MQEPLTSADVVDVVDGHRWPDLRCLTCSMRSRGMRITWQRQSTWTQGCWRALHARAGWELLDVRPLHPGDSLLTSR
jgi:hypothetical protein